MATLWSPICDQLGIKVPIFGFAHDIATVAAISNAGGYGVYGATRRFPDEITQELAQIKALVGERPFGVDLVLPPGMPEHDSREAIEIDIPDEHKAFVQSIIEQYNIPPATEPGMRTRFIRSAEIEAAQIQSVLASPVEYVRVRHWRARSRHRGGQGARHDHPCAHWQPPPRCPNHCRRRRYHRGPGL